MAARELRFEHGLVHNSRNPHVLQLRLHKRLKTQKNSLALNVTGLQRFLTVIGRSEPTYRQDSKKMTAWRAIELMPSLVSAVTLTHNHQLKAQRI
jgi:hypothetical protein